MSWSRVANAPCSASALFAMKLRKPLWLTQVWQIDNLGRSRRLLHTRRRGFLAAFLNALQHERLRQFQLLREELCHIRHGALKANEIISRYIFRAIEQRPRPARARAAGDVAEHIL